MEVFQVEPSVYAGEGYNGRFILDWLRGGSFRFKSHNTKYSVH